MQELILALLPNKKQDRIVNIVNGLQAGRFRVGSLAE